MCMVFCCIPYTSIIRIYKKQKCNSILILGVLEHMAFADLMYALDSSPSGKIRLRRDVPALTVTQDEHTVAAIITNWSAEHRINHMPNLRFHFNTWGRCSGSIRKCQTWLHMSNSWKIFGWYPKCFWHQRRATTDRPQLTWKLNLGPWRQTGFSQNIMWIILDPVRLHMAPIFDVSGHCSSEHLGDLLENGPFTSIELHVVQWAFLAWVRVIWAVWTMHALAMALNRAHCKQEKHLKTPKKEVPFCYSVLIFLCRAFFGCGEPLMEQRWKTNLFWILG